MDEFAKVKPREFKKDFVMPDFSLDSEESKSSGFQNSVISLQDGEKLD